MTAAEGAPRDVTPGDPPAETRGIPGACAPPTLERVVLDILGAIRDGESFAARDLDGVLRKNSALLPGDERFAKKQLMPFYLRVKQEEPGRWERWGIDPRTEGRFLRLVQMKPRRTASGVATITVITKPWTCSGNCLFCPNDVRMPKSYLHDEPACQRAERNWFDPYLQVTARLRTLMQMGHAVDKVELIVLGGTWDDYPLPYRIWFVRELFRALNDACADTAAESSRRGRYADAGIPCDDVELESRVAGIQAEVTAGAVSFNAAITRLYGPASPWERVSAWQQAEFEQLEREHRRNEDAACRCVGLVMETRPDRVSAASLLQLRRMGCTKVQIGVQSVGQATLDRAGRRMQLRAVRDAFRLLRLFGFKIHAHFMVNLPGATPDDDVRDYREFATGEAYRPDEVKLYPCALVEASALRGMHAAGTWEPYDEETLVGVLAADVLATPPYTRISRMIRDFSSSDIVAGNKKTNLRQLVESRLAAGGRHVDEIRYREIGTEGADAAALSLIDVPYRTDATDEHFLQWVTPEGKVAGFLRLSLPHAGAVDGYPGGELPVHAGEAMVREVHVYGKVARIHGTGDGAQHLGLGTKLLERAAAMARDAGYRKLNVISAVGTRGYYRARGFHDNGLYQQMDLR